MKRTLINLETLKEGVEAIAHRRAINIHESPVSLSLAERSPKPMDNNKRKLWRITRDLISGGSGGYPSQVGTWGEDGKGCSVWKAGEARSQTHDGQNVCPINDEQMTVKFRIKDDDGELYYEGVMTKVCSVESPLAPLDDFAMPNAGATSLELQDDKGRWDPI